MAYYLKLISLNFGLKTKELRVLLYLLPKLIKNEKNSEYTKIPNSRIMADLGISASQASKALHNLIAEDILIQSIDDGLHIKYVKLNQKYKKIEFDNHQSIKCVIREQLDDDLEW